MNQSTLNASKSRRLFISVIATVVIVLSFVIAPTLAQEEEMEKPNIVLVHGAWADGSSWSPVIERLQAAGYNVVAPQFPHTSLDANVARLHQVLNSLEGPTILAGHSYGGQIITVGAVDQPNVIGLVYIAAFALDEGESIGGLLAQGEPSPAIAHLIVDELGYAWLPQDDFINHFAADIDPVITNVMWATQQPLHLSALEDVVGVPAWKSLPTWYMVATNDEAIPPDVERLFAGRMGATTVEVESSHVPMFAAPDAVADLIMEAATVPAQ